MTEDQQAAVARLEVLRRRRAAASRLFTKLDSKVREQRERVNAALGVGTRIPRKRPAKTVVSE